MTIRVDSRFHFTSLVEIVDGNDQPVENVRIVMPYPRPRITTEFSPDLVSYHVRTGDSVRSLAARFLGRSDLWWAIAEFSGVIDPFTETQPGATTPRAGGALRIPSLDLVMFDLLRFER